MDHGNSQSFQGNVHSFQGNGGLTRSKRWFVFEVSPIFDMNPEPETDELNKIPYTDYKQTANYRDRRLEGYRNFGKRLIAHAKSNSSEVAKRVLFVDIDNTLNLAYLRFQQQPHNQHHNIRHPNLAQEDPNHPSRVLQDPLIPNAVWALHTLRNSQKYRIVYLTARAYPQALEITQEWLFERNQFPVSPVIITKTPEEKMDYIRFEQRRSEDGSVQAPLLIDDLSRAHHQPVFEPQTKFLNLLDAARIDYIKFDTSNGETHWMQIVEGLVR
jgi:hypothetical protein